MDAKIWISASEPVDECASLINWLQGQRELQGRVYPARRQPREGELGSMVEFLTVAVGSGGTGIALSRSLIAWLSNRHSDVSITVTTSAGTVQLDALRVKDALPLLEKVLQHDVTDHDV
ncbi:hypothetical protein [Nonomuraea sp. NPDC049141]|uniref:effector-associated constant component EACC1 n=1 Tax=Nonomuraea sp. NPDC049141 TaxID=3155500 RepID=UPI00341143A7